MDAVIEQINSAGKAFVGFAWPMLVQSSVLIAILLVADFLLRKNVLAVFRYWLWMLVLIKLVLPTTLSSPVSVGRIIGEPVASVRIAVPERPVVDTISDTQPPSLPVESVAVKQVDLSPAAPIRSQPIAPMAPMTWQGGILLVWLAVVITMFLLLLQRAVFVCGLVRQSMEANGLMNDTLRFCCKLMGVKQTIGLKVSPNATSPAVCGLFRPVILVPQGLGSNLGISSLRVVLMHELAHIKRGDLWVNLVQTLLQIAYFYNPLLWLANWVVRRVREQAVDEAVQVALGEKAQQYPETLLSVAKLVFQRPALSLRLVGVVESKSALTSRIKRMLAQPIPKTAKLGIIGSLAIILLAAGLLPMARASQKSVVDNAFRKQLPNGVTVELVGVCDYPSEGKQWWKPDGLPLGFNIETYDPSHYEDKNNGYEIAYKFEAPDGVYVGQPKVKGSTSQSGLEVKSPSGIQAVRSHINVWGNTTKVKFPVAAGEWKKLGQTSGGGQTTAMVGSKKIMFGPAEGTREKLVIAVTDDLDDYDSEYRLVAFDNNGTIVLSEHNWFSNKGLRQHTFVFSGLDPAGVARFEFQTRPYEWVEFKNVNVPLRPTGKWNWQTGTRTTPDFTIKGIVTDAQTGKPIAGAKVGDHGYDGNRRFGITDANGHYSYKTWSEEHAISVQADGYQKQIKGFHTRLFPLDLFEKEKAINFSLEPGAKTDVRVEVLQSIDFKITSSEFLDGDSIAITELAGSAGMIKPGHTYTVNGRYTLKSHDEAMLHVYATNGEVNSVQGPPVKRGEGEFSRTFTLLENGDLHLSFYPAKGGNGFGGVYFAQKGAEVEAASRPVTGKIDVAADDFSVRPYPEGGLYTVTVSIKNKGSSKSPEFRVYFYRNDPNRLNPMTHGAGPIEPGGVWNEMSMPFGLKEGTNEIVVVLDPANKITESNEMNNEASVKVVVKDGKIAAVEKQVSPSSATAPAEKKVVGIGPGWQKLQRVIGDNYKGSIGGYSNDEQKCGEYFEKVLSWARPGDIFVMMFAFDEENFGHSQMVPKEYQDLLPKPWKEIKEQVNRGEVLELKGKARGLDTIVLAAPTLDQLDELIKSTELLQPFKTFAEQNEAKAVEAAGGVDIIPAGFDILLDRERGDCSLVVSIRNDSEVTIPKFKLNFYRGDPADNLDETGKVHGGWHEAGPIEPGKSWNECTRYFNLPDGEYEFNVILNINDSVAEADKSNNRASMKVVVKDGKIVEKKASFSSAKDSDKQVMGPAIWPASTARRSGRGLAFGGLSKQVISAAEE
jgi:beta-lactamase regulating signal transducer with metallopeptidase domain